MTAGQDLEESRPVRDHNSNFEQALNQLNKKESTFGRGGQNVRLAAKLTGWRIDIKGDGKEVATTDGEQVEIVEKTEEEIINNKE